MSTNISITPFIAVVKKFLFNYHYVTAISYYRTKWTSPHHLPKSLSLEGLVHFVARIAYHEVIISLCDSAHIIFVQ